MDIHLQLFELILFNAYNAQSLDSEKWKNRSFPKYSQLFELFRIMKPVRLKNFMEIGTQLLW